MRRGRRHSVAERPFKWDRPVEGLHHVGNSTHLVMFEGVRILTDPWLAEPAEGLLAHTVPPVTLPTDVEVVLVSHRHEDHFDPMALARLRKDATVVLPAELEPEVRRLGFADVRGVLPGQRITVRGLAVEAIKGRHTVPELCFRVERNGRAFFFGGDTMLTPEIEALARVCSTTFAILPGERSTLLGRHAVMTPEEAVGLAQRLGAKVAVLSHHEQAVARRFPFGWMVRIPPLRVSDFPPWFKTPSPGDHVAFPWTSRAETSPPDARPDPTTSQRSPRPIQAGALP